MKLYNRRYGKRSMPERRGEARILRRFIDTSIDTRFMFTACVLRVNSCNRRKKYKREKTFTKKVIVSPSRITLSYHPLISPSHITLSYHPLISPSHITLSYHPLVSPSHITLLYHPLISPSPITLLYHPLVWTPPPPSKVFSEEVEYIYV